MPTRSTSDARRRERRRRRRLLKPQSANARFARTVAVEAAVDESDVDVAVSVCPAADDLALTSSLQSELVHVPLLYGAVLDGASPQELERLAARAERYVAASAELVVELTP